MDIRITLDEWASLARLADAVREEVPEDSAATPAISCIDDLLNAIWERHQAERDAPKATAPINQSTSQQLDRESNCPYCGATAGAFHGYSSILERRHGYRWVCDRCKASGPVRATTSQAIAETAKLSRRAGIVEET